MPEPTPEQPPEAAPEATPEVVADPVERSSRVWTVPNMLSMLRLAGVPVFLWLVLGPEADGWALALLMVSGVTDYLDGYLARKLDQTSTRRARSSTRWPTASTSWRS